MSDDIEEQEDEMVEIDWEPLQGAVDAFHDGGLDFRDNRALLDHLGTLLGSLLRKIQAEENIEEEEIAELAAETAAFAVDLAFSTDELPDFVPSDEQEEN